MSNLSTTLQTISSDKLTSIEEVKEIVTAALLDIENNHFEVDIQTEVFPPPGTPQQLIGEESKIRVAKITLKINYEN